MRNHWTNLSSSYSRKTLTWVY